MNRIETSLAARAERTPFQLLITVGVAAFVLGLVMPMPLRILATRVAATAGAKRLAGRMPQGWLVRPRKQLAVPSARS